MQYSIPKNVFDIFPGSKESWKDPVKWSYIENIIREVASLYNFEEIRTPIFEHTNLFIRSIGDSSDVVSKEMYTFNDRKNRSLTLRPEGTAPVIRSVIENQLYLKPSKLFYVGPMFRYERQQAGRYRQHHQFGLEAIGVKSPHQDAEVILLLLTFLTKVGLSNLSININSLGNKETINLYSFELRKYFQTHFDNLSQDSQVRFHKNILRILDSKDSKDIEIIKKAPLITDFLDEESKIYFESVIEILQNFGVTVTKSPFLVRGLDYYTSTVFEIITTDSSAAQNSVAGGGRYDNLIQELGGPSTPAFGFGCGIERVIQTAIHQNVTFPEVVQSIITFIPTSPRAVNKCFDLTQELRNKGIKADLYLKDKKIKKVLKDVCDQNTKYIVIIGDEELDSNYCTLKQINSNFYEKISISSLVDKVIICQQNTNDPTLAEN